MKTLILYSTKTGTVKKCSELLAKEIGRDVSIYNIADGIPKLDDFDFIVCGASIRMGKLICCGFDEKAEQYLSEVFPDTIAAKALIKASFGGELKADKQKGFDKLITKLFLRANEENEKFVMPTIFTEEIGRFADRIKGLSI